VRAPRPHEDEAGHDAGLGVSGVPYDGLALVVERISGFVRRYGEV